MPEFLHLGHGFHYEIGGAGKPMIAIPGMMSDSASWGPIVAALQARHLLIRPDPRCTGRSPLIATSIKDMAADVIALMDHLQIAKSDIVSHSMGSRVALELAQTYPNRVDRMILSAVMPRFPALNCAVFDSLLQVREQAGTETFLRALFPWLFAPAFFEEEERVEAAVAASLAYPFAQSVAGMRLQVAALRQARALPDIARINAPTLALFGGDDRLVPVTHAPELLSPLPDLKVRVIKEAGHSIHWDQPEAVTAAITQFLNAPN